MMKRVKVRSFELAFGAKHLCVSLLLFAFFISCSSSSKEDAAVVDDQTSWEVTLSGKVGFPQKGQITIQELKNSGTPWQDTKKQLHLFEKNKIIRPWLL